MPTNNDALHFKTLLPAGRQSEVRSEKDIRLGSPSPVLITRTPLDTFIGEGRAEWLQMRVILWPATSDADKGIKFAPP